MLDHIENTDCLEQVREKGEYLKNKLMQIPEIVKIDGMGLMLGAELKGKKAAEMAKSALDNGLLVLTAKDRLRFLPPLTISYEEIDKGVEILKKILD